jgi:hypothetical protein
MRLWTNLHSSNVHYEKEVNLQRGESVRFDMAMPTLSDLQTKLDSVRREVRNLTVMGMDPKQPPDQLALIKQLEISARAEQRLRKMALGYELSRTKS